MTLTIFACTLSAVIPTVVVWAVMRAKLNAAYSARVAAEKKLAVRKKIRSLAAKKGASPNPIKSERVIAEMRDGPAAPLRPRKVVVSDVRAERQRKKMKVAA